LAAPLSAQFPTGEIRIHAVGAFAPRVSDTTGYGYLSGPPGGGAVAGLGGDLSFVAGRLRLGPEAQVLRGPSRRVWSLGGVARYEFGGGVVRLHGVFGAGAYFWSREIIIDLAPEFGGPYPSWQSDVNYFSMSLGGGVTAGASGGRVAFITEFRVHRSFQSGGGTGIRSLLSLGVGGRIAW
jgi:hypothetical protein